MQKELVHHCELQLFEQHCLCSASPRRHQEIKLAHQQQVSSGWVDHHGLVLEGVGLDQLLLLLPALLLHGVVVVQLIQALEERENNEETEGWRGRHVGGKDRLKHRALH